MVEEFGRYYGRLPPSELEVKSIRERELAFLQFGEQVMIRHLQFQDTASLKEYLVAKVPANVYYSSAYYREPQAPDMNDKGWRGADLVFDIDVDHIETKCKIDHDTWKCLECGAASKGFPPESCPKCGMKKIDTVTWVCDRCLDVAKKEIYKLLDDFLIPDFGVSLNDVEICFSGHRGYHLHVLAENLRSLSSDGRREVADYVRGVGLDPKAHGFRQVKGDGPIVGPDMRNGGWRGRFARAIYAYVSGCGSDDLRKAIGIVPADAIFKNRAKFLENISSTPTYWGGMKGYSMETLCKLAMLSVKDIVCNIDERVTLDIKRLIRHPGSLHGKTGLKTALISYSDLERFDPFSDAVAFRDGNIKIYVRDIPRVRIGDYEAGPVKNKEMDVPKAFGLYLICKGAAEPRT